MSYRMPFGQDWLPDPADCVDAGGVWNDDTGLCDVHGPRCQAQGGSWDPSTLTCTLADGTQVDIRQWCQDNDRHWDPVHELCFDPIPQQQCVDRGGYWDGQLCHRQAPPSTRPVLTRAGMSTVIAVGGAVVLGLGMLYYVRR